MKLCVFVPGICGSALDAVGSRGRDNLWLNRKLLAVGGVGWLALSPDGVTPPSGSFPTIEPTGPLSPYYDVTQTTFRQQLAGQGYELQVLGVDWRQSILRSGAGVAQIVANQLDSYLSVCLVGHSQGGLIVRRAWQVLNQTGQAAKITRVITLGTPHSGSWEPCALFCGITDYIPQMVLIVPAVIVPGGQLLVLGILDKIKQIAATWPGLYELLPLAPVNPVDDPAIAGLYQASSWPPAWGLQQRWLDHTSGPFRAWLTDLTQLPPFEVLTTVAGNTQDTPMGWTSADQIGNPDLLHATGVGDGVVLTTSALLAGSKQYLVSAGHQSMPETLSSSGQLIDLVTEVRTPAPPPPPATLTSYGSVILRGPPMAITGLYGVDP
jgi:hypothetical protein